jgi:Domain of unknown function (DUF4145)
MDRHIWTQELSAHNCPPWPCNVCGKGNLTLVKDSLIFKETIHSARSHNHEGFDFDWIEYIFTAWAQCPSCKQEFAIAGTGGVAPQYVSENDWEYEAYFIPKICNPMPNIFKLPAKCPDDIKNELYAAFAIFWSNRAACAGRLRVALECLMNHIGVPKRRKGVNGKFSDLTLHARIEAFANKEPTIGPQLMALKWIGNTGSHDSHISANDLLDSFEIMEHALAEIIGGHSARVADLAKKLTKKHGSK